LIDAADSIPSIGARMSPPAYWDSRKGILSEDTSEEENRTAIKYEEPSLGGGIPQEKWYPLEVQTRFCL